MSNLLTPIAPSGATVRDAPTQAPVLGPKPVSPVESAIALRPASEGATQTALRRSGARDRPVGPPPAFDVNVLDDLRERLRDVDLVRSSDAPPREGEGPPDFAYAELSETPGEGAVLDRKL